MPNNSAPIGIFDSGVGGLTVAKALSNVLPNEQFIYFGDTAHLPYGDKSRELIRHYSVHIAEFLIEKGVKHVVIACNSASASAYDDVKTLCEEQGIHVTNVIDPVIDYIKSKPFHTIGIIGTKATIGSGIFQHKLSDLAHLDVRAKSTPLLASMIEEGFAGSEVSRGVLKSYLSDSTLNGIQAIALACTHYPIIANEVNDFFNGSVEVLDSAGIVAHKVKETLEQENLLNSTGNANYTFYVSDITEGFQHLTSLFFGKDLSLHLENLWTR